MGVPTALLRLALAMVMMILFVAALSAAARPALEGRASPRLRAAG